MAASNLRTEATYITHEEFTVDTSDHQDHTFSGIMFPVKCRNILPVDHVVITSLGVRGDLGPISIWVTKDDVDGTFHMDTNSANHNRARSMRQIDMKKSEWVQIYSMEHQPSRNDYTQLDLSQNPIRINPDRVRGIYIHSTFDGDTAIVYDNKRDAIKRYEDPFLTIFSGRAHVSTEPFGRIPIWGMGNAWRDNREFVGKIKYGVVYKLWNPTIFPHFSGPAFHEMVRTMMKCQKRWPHCPVSKLPDDCLFYIFNMCHWNWAGDSLDQIRRHKRSMVARSCSSPSTTNQTGQDSGNSTGAEINKQAESNEQSQCNNDYDDDEDDDDEDDVEDDDEEDDDADVEEDDDDDEEFEEDEEEQDSDDDEEESDDDDDDDDDDGYQDHRGSSSFFFQIFDDLADPVDDEAMAETARNFLENQRRLWFRTQFLQYAAAPRVQVHDDDENDEEEQA